MSDTRDRLSPTTIALHWVVGVGVLTLMTVGWYMAENEVRELYPIHKSMGMLMAVFIVWRLGYRLTQGWPPAVRSYAAWEQRLARTVQWVLLIGTVLFPLSGMVMSVAGGSGLQFFGIDLVAANIVDGQRVALNKELGGMAREVHGVLLWVMLLAVLLHVTGALKHHLLDGDSTLRRMLGRR